MTFGLTIEKILLIGVIAAMIIGPERLPAAAEALGRAVRRARDLAHRTQDRLRDEVGPDLADVDWQRLDPRRYDPRRIVREALLTDAVPSPAPAPSPVASTDVPQSSGDEDPPTAGTPAPPAAV